MPVPITRILPVLTLLLAPLAARAQTGDAATAVVTPAPSAPGANASPAPAAEVPPPASGAGAGSPSAAGGGGGTATAPTPDAPPVDAGREAQSAAPQIDPQALRDLISTIRDDKERELFLRRLETLLAAQERTETPAQEALGLLAQLGQAVDARIAAVRRAVGDLAASSRQIGFLVTWLQLEFGDPARRKLWRGLLGQLGGAILLGAAAGLLFRLATRGRLRAAEERVRAGGPKSPAIVTAFLIDIVAVSLFAATVTVTLTLSGVSSIVLAAAKPVIAGALVGRLFAAIAKALLAPHAPERRILPVDDVEARRLMRVLTWLNALLVYATALLWLADVLGLPWTIRGFLERILYFLAALILSGLCVRYREPVGNWLAGQAARTAGLFARFLPWERLAHSWHFVAMAIIFAHYLVFALQLPDGLLLLFRVTVLTILLLVLARLAMMGIDALFREVTASTGEEEAPTPGERIRRRYLRWTRAALRVVVVALALVLVLEVWGFDLLGWLTAGDGRMLLAGATRLAVALLVAVAVIEIANAAARRYMDATTADGRPLYSNRTRTLASIARNGVILLASITFLLLFLSEIGVEAGPLLAGAGVVGLAVGFGSQKLVQDLITGLFILLGDTIRVGDIVDLGGKAGVVEGMSMRTVTLRGYDGNVHTIPYSSIDTVTNMTKDFSFWVAEIGVAYREDVDQVIRVLEEIDAQMRREWPFRRIVLQPIEIAGLDRFGDSAVVIKARIRTRPGEQWRVGREFNRRVKKRFDELGIEIPFPHRTLYFGVDRNGTAPPAFVRMIGDEAPTGREPGNPPVEAARAADAEPRG